MQVDGVYNSHEESIKGSITPGKLADFRCAGGRSLHRKQGDDPRHRDRLDGHRWLDRIPKVTGPLRPQDTHQAESRVSRPSIIRQIFRGFSRRSSSGRASSGQS